MAHVHAWSANPWNQHTRTHICWKLPQKSVASASDLQRGNKLCSESEMIAHSTLCCYCTFATRPTTGDNGHQNAKHLCNNTYGHVTTVARLGEISPIGRLLGNCGQNMGSGNYGLTFRLLLDGFGGLLGDFSHDDGAVSSTKSGSAAGTCMHYAEVNYSQAVPTLTRVWWN